MGERIGLKILQGFLISLLIAVIVGVAGGVFEALVLLPKFGFVTFTLGPDVVFLVCNLLFLITWKNKYIKIGAGIGFVNVLVVIFTSIYSFFRAISLYHPELGF